MLKERLYTVGKQYKFDAAHFIPNHPLCGKVHGHTWKVEVSITGTLNKDSMVIDFHTLNFLMGPIIAVMDHTLLNDNMLTPTVEFISHHIATNLAGAIDTYSHIENIKTVTAKVQEGEGGFAIASIDIKDDKV